LRYFVGETQAKLEVWDELEMQKNALRGKNNLFSSELTKACKKVVLPAQGHPEIRAILFISSQ
jgi:hypothetical protein